MVRESYLLTLVSSSISGGSGLWLSFAASLSSTEFSCACLTTSSFVLQRELRQVFASLCNSVTFCQLCVLCSFESEYDYE